MRGSGSTPTSGRRRSCGPAAPRRFVTISAPRTAPASTDCRRSRCSPTPASLLRGLTRRHGTATGCNQRRRRGEPDAAAELGQGEAGVSLELGEESIVGLVEKRIFGVTVVLPSVWRHRCDYTCPLSCTHRADAINLQPLPESIAPHHISIS